MTKEEKGWTDYSATPLVMGVARQAGLAAEGVLEAGDKLSDLRQEVGLALMGLDDLRDGAADNDGVGNPGHCGRLLGRRDAKADADRNRRDGPNAAHHLR